jgi:hypothetical protein
MKIEDIAQVAHEINKAYCSSLGDDTQPDWIDAPQWQKDSAVSGVQFHISTPDAGGDESHNAWLAVKAADGWKYGEVKDADKKEHPCFIPYSELPLEQRVKDYLFAAVVDSLCRFIPVIFTLDDFKQAAKEIGMVVHNDMRMPVDLLDGIDVDGERIILTAFERGLESMNDFKADMLGHKLTHIAFYQYIPHRKSDRSIGHSIRFCALTEEEFLIKKKEIK